MKHGIQRQFAREAGVSPQQLNNILKGRRRPSWTLAKKLAATSMADPTIFMDGRIPEIESAIAAWAERPG